MEQFSNGYGKTNTKVITPANNDRSKQRDEPIRIPSNYFKAARSAGKITHGAIDFGSVSHWLQKLAREF